MAISDTKDVIVSILSQFMKIKQDYHYKLALKFHCDHLVLSLKFGHSQQFSLMNSFVLSMNRGGQIHHFCDS